MGKDHQKAVKKSTENRAKKRCERLFVDVRSLPNESLAGSRYWILIVDNATRYKWSYFIRTKDELVNTMGRFLIKKLNNHGIKYLRCDNAGENMKLSNVCDRYGIEIEYTAPNTPQQNGVMERGFVIIRQRAVAMMHYLNLDEEEKKLLWAEALPTSTLLTNIATNISTDMQSSYTKMFEGETPKILKFLKTFGSKCYATIRYKRGKYEGRAKYCFMVGYAMNHAPDCYCFYDPQMNKIILSRDVVWDEKSVTSDLEKDRSIERECHIETGARKFPVHKNETHNKQTSLVCKDYEKASSDDNLTLAQNDTCENMSMEESEDATDDAPETSEDVTIVDSAHERQTSIGLNLLKCGGKIYGSLTIPETKLSRLELQGTSS